MSTSLAQQLKKLAVPQTSLLEQAKRKHSLLFDPREAAKFDRDTFYEIGVSGLEELVKLNPKFEEFNSSLFDLSSRSLERSVEDKKANKKLNKIIRRFLLLLSPYFLIKSAHKALEWLINRFHIESFNVDDLMSLIFPYHNTRIFVRVLQMMDVSDPANRWHWLHPLQASGVPLSKTALLNRCASDPSFLNFICKTTSDAVKEYKERGHTLATLFAFHCTTLIGGLEYVSHVDELQVMHILKSLLEGLTSPVVDYVAASYMIVAQLIRRTTLNHDIFYAILHKVAKCRHKSLHAECGLLLVMLFQTQREKEFPPIPAKTLNKLVSLDWLAPVLVQLRNANVNVTMLYRCLLRQVLQNIQTRTDDRSEICNFAECLIRDLLDSASAPMTIQIIIESFDVDGLTSSQKNSPESEEEDEEGKDTVGMNDAEEIMRWYSGLLHTLERKCPEFYDKEVHKYLSIDSTGVKHSRAVRVLLGVEKDAASRFHLSNIDLFEKIHHPKATLRAEALRFLVDNIDSLEGYQRDLISVAIPARLKDDNSKVLKKVLSFPTEELVRVVGNDTLLEDLIAISSLCLRNSEKPEWSSVMRVLVKHLCCEQVQGTSSLIRTRVLLAILPFVFPLNKSNKLITLDILNQQSCVEKYQLLSVLSREVQSKGKKVTALDTCCALVKHLSGGENIVDIEDVLECSEKIMKNNAMPVHVFFLLLISGSSLSVKMKPSPSRKLLDNFVSQIGKYQMAAVAGDLMESTGKIMLKNLKEAMSGHLPVSGYLFFLSQLTKCTDLPAMSDIKWWDLYFCDQQENQGAFSFAVRMLEILLAGCGMKTNSMRLLYASSLKQFFEAHFPDMTCQLRFLCNVCACPGRQDDGISWLELRLRCLNLVSALLDSNCSMTWTLSLEEPVVPTLLIAASSPVTPLRHLALNCLLKLGSCVGANLNKNTFMALIQRIQERCEEIKLDAEQFPLVMYTALSPDPAVQSLLKSDEKLDLAAVLETLVKLTTCNEAPLYLTVGLLNMLESVNSQSLFTTFVPLAREALTCDDGRVDEMRSAVLCNIVQRLTVETAPCLKLADCWNLVHSALLDWRSTVQLTSGETTWPTVLVMQQITREVYEVLDETVQQNLLTTFIKAASECELPEVGSAASKVIKKIVLDCKLIAVELDKMKNAAIETQSPAVTRLGSRRKLNQPLSPELIQTEAWRYGVTLLEWIQSKKKLQSTHLLLAPLFAILNKCLEFEQQAPVEYTKQLVLSCILHCCQKLSPDGAPVDKTVLQAFNAEAVVQCIRASPNPQTHHHALLVLAHIAGMMPEQVLHNIMAIFTFMGSSILRQDDAYSFQVISKIVDTIVPILVKASEGMGKHTVEMDGAVCSVLRVFADTVLHVPLHRRLLLYQKLLGTLGPEHSLWLFVCLVLEGHVLHTQEEQPRERGEMPQRQEFILNLTRCFPPSTIITTCIRLVSYVQSLPVDKGQSEKAERQVTVVLSMVPGLFNAETHTPKQLRHYRYSICTFLSCLLSSPQFVKQVAELSDSNIQQLEPLYQELVENLLTHVKSISLHQAQNSRSEQAIKYWNAMLSLAYDILDKVNALLPGPMFLVVVRGLLSHKLPAVRRKAMELLNTRLQHQTEIFSLCDREAFYKLLDPLMAVMKSIGGEDVEPEIETNQQVAMLSIKLLARQLAPEDPASFKQILEHVTELLKCEQVQNNLLASVVLCLAELVTVLRAHSIAQLKQFMPAIIRILKKQKDVDSPNLVLVSVVTAIQKIVENLSNFLSPYLDKLLIELSIQSIKWQHLSEDTKVSPVIHKLKAIRQKLSGSIPPRVLVPCVGRCYMQLVQQEQYAALGPLLSVLADSFSVLAASELTQMMLDLTSFFLLALQFRSDCNNSVSQTDIAEAESHVTSTLVALILKLSESTFRPLYLSLFHWATNASENKERIITFYRLSSSIAEALKGLFLLFAGRLVLNAAKLLDSINVSKKTEGELMFDEEKSQLLLEYILQTLHRIFMYDSGQGFVNKERFDALMLPIVNQLENTLGGVEALKVRASTLLAPCITQFAVAVADDGLWKQLNYQILLKTQHNLPEVRLVALEVHCEMVRKLGEDFLPLLPESVPFLSELLEDEDETVEAACQKAVQELEEILGEPIKKYL